MAHGVLHTVSESAAQTPIAPLDLSAMVAARICHDLVSPLGAIGNGLELMELSGQPVGAELDLVAESTRNANAKLRFFRIAFGSVTPEQLISQAEVRSILESLGKFQKHKVIWQCCGDPTRRQVKLVFLLLMCLETTLPWGGEIEIAVWQEGARLIARSERLKIDDDLWQPFETGENLTELSSARVQFALALAEIAAQSARVGLSERASTLTLDITFD
ncbi:MAG: histidine phosphotransferase family protein [Roseinatronobacter sp.]